MRDNGETTMVAGHSAARRMSGAVVLLLALVLAAGGSTAGRTAAAPEVAVVVRGLPGGVAAVAEAVRAAGGVVGLRLGLVDGVAARVPAGALARLRNAPGVLDVTPDGAVQLHDADEQPATEPPAADPPAVAAPLEGTPAEGAVDTPAAAEDANPEAREHERAGGGWGAGGRGTTLAQVARTVSADDLWRQGITGQGVGVALIDSGVVGVDGLDDGRVVLGPDLSLESQVPALAHLDTYGHGTHLAGIIAGDARGATGIAPGARLVSLKVAAGDGATDVSQVIAAIDWVVAHRDDPGLNIRVLNLSFGTDGVQDYRLDPLAFAVEAAWRHGIVVVVAGGNAGFGSASLNNPATDPLVLAVGAADTQGTARRQDDVVAAFSSRGDERRHADLIAPGSRIRSLRDPGSYLDLAYPEARAGRQLFRGSGTSQSAAVVSGAAALLLQQRPELTPDQVKALLMQSAYPLEGADPVAQGAGMLNVGLASRQSPPPDAVQAHEPATGLGSLEAARGSAHITDGTAELRGERDLFGPWDGAAWSARAGVGAAWDGTDWNGRTWSGATWDAVAPPWSAGAWSGHTWSGHTWSGHTWSGHTWSGHTWSGHTWSGHTWSGHTWSGHTWSGHTWSGHTWSGHTWSGHTWSGHTWSGTTWA